MNRPKNSRRRHLKNRLRGGGRNRRCRSADPKCVSSTPCRLKRELTYAKCKRLESCARDPIGYVGSTWNLYESYDGMPCTNIDPSGLKCATSTFYCVAVFCREIGWAWGSCKCCHGSLPEDIIEHTMDRYIQSACQSSTYYALAKGSVITYQQGAMTGTLQRLMRMMLGPGITCRCT